MIRKKKVLKYPKHGALGGSHMIDSGGYEVRGMSTREWGNRCAFGEV